MKFNPEDPKWTAYVLGELDDASRAEIEQLLETSEEARALVDELRIATLMLKDELAPEVEPVLHPQQRAAVRAAVSAKPRRWMPPVWAAGLAAAGLIWFAVMMPSMLRSPQSVEEARTGDVAAPQVNALVVEEAAGGSTPATGGPDLAGQVSAPIADQAAQNVNAVELQKSAEEQTNLPLPAELVVTSSVGSAAPTANGLQMGQQGAGSGGARDATFDAGTATRSGVLGGVLRQAETGSGPVPAAAPPAMPAPAPPPPPANAAAQQFLEARRDVRDLRDLDIRPRQEFNTEAYDRINDNPFVRVQDNPLATFSIDVDTASYANMRRFLTQNQLPPKDAIRIEELINYFSYNYAQPTGAHPVAPNMEVAAAPWNPEHRLVRVGIKARDLDPARRPSSNLVFLIDVSGSMSPPEKLPLLKSAMKLLVDRLGENDRVSIVVYAGASGMALPPTNGDRKEVILRALENLHAGGSTNGASGIQLAYNTAVANFIRGGVNRVVLMTDGDFNVGITNQGDLTRLIEDRARSGVFLSVLGFGMGNLKDSTLETLADRGNGNYAYIDTLNEARKVLVEEMGGTLVTIAKDVKIQVEFNPAQVNGYRLIGYENRILAAEDFNNDLKDAGDMGSGHTVTALFEVVPRSVDMPGTSVDPLRYQARPVAPITPTATSREMLTLKVRYKDPDGTESKLLEVPLTDGGRSFGNASEDFRFAASVAAFGMVLRDSPYKGNASIDSALQMAEQSRGNDRGGYRTEFVGLIRRARALGGGPVIQTPFGPAFRRDTQ